MSIRPTAQKLPGRREAEARATREALIQAALELFTERGYAGVGTEEIVSRAKVTRGALYHHFTDKRDLFRAVFERVEGDLMERIGATMEGADDAWNLMVAGMRAFLDACEEPAVKQISLIDAPAVLGWEEWREIDNRHGLGLTRAALQGAVDGGRPPSDCSRADGPPVRGRALRGGLRDRPRRRPRKARAEVEEALTQLVEGLRT